MPAILRVAEETKLRDIPDDAMFEGMLIPVQYCCILLIFVLIAKTMYRLEVLLMKPKPKGVKCATKSRMSAIICFADVSFCTFRPMYR